MNKPKVTVLMSVYNGGKKLKDAIDSILEQSFFNFEFVIINDCSTDKSRELILNYRDNRINFIENDINLGLTMSLNKGLKIAKGEYIARIDSDDISDLERLEKQVKYLDENEQISVVGSWAIVDEKTNKWEAKMPKTHDEILGSIFFGNSLVHPSVMIRKKAIFDVGLYNEEFKYAQDYELWFRLLGNNYKLSNIPESLIIYNLNSNSVSVLNNNAQEEYAIKALCYGFRKVLKIDFTENEVKLFRNCFSKKYECDKNEKKIIKYMLKEMGNSLKSINKKSISIFNAKKKF